MADHNRAKFRSITLERETITNLSLLSEFENRSMIGEVDWLVNERMKELGLGGVKGKRVILPEVKN